MEEIFIKKLLKTKKLMIKNLYFLAAAFHLLNLQIFLTWATQKDKTSLLKIKIFSKRPLFFIKDITPLVQTQAKTFFLVFTNFLEKIFLRITNYVWWECF